MNRSSVARRRASGVPFVFDANSFTAEALSPATPWAAGTARVPAGCKIAIGCCWWVANTARDVTGISLGGVAMSEWVDGGTGDPSLFYLENPSPGDAAVSITAGGNSDRAAHAIILFLGCEGGHAITGVFAQLDDAATTGTNITTMDTRVNGGIPKYVAQQSLVVHFVMYTDPGIVAVHFHSAGPNGCMTTPNVANSNTRQMLANWGLVAPGQVNWQFRSVCTGATDGDLISLVFQAQRLINS